MKEFFYSKVGKRGQKFDPRKFFCTVSFFLAIIDYMLQLTSVVSPDTERVMGLFVFAGSMKAFYQWNKKIMSHP